MTKVEFEILPRIKFGGGRYRALFEVVGIRGRDSHLKTLEVSLPGWDSGRTFSISARFIPAELRSKINPGGHFLAEVNLGANKPKGLRPTNFELIPPM